MGKGTRDVKQAWERYPGAAARPSAGCQNPDTVPTLLFKLIIN